MAGLPRGICPTCGENVALRKNGTTREHWIRRAGTALVAANPQSGKLCAGSGSPAVKKEPRPPHALRHHVLSHEELGAIADALEAVMSTDPDMPSHETTMREGERILASVRATLAEPDPGVHAITTPEHAREVVEQCQGEEPLERGRAISRCGLIVPDRFLTDELGAVGCCACRSLVAAAGSAR